MDKAMIVAGIGCMKGTPEAGIVGALDAALASHGIVRGALAVIATGGPKRNEEGIAKAARTLGVALVAIDDGALKDAGGRTLTFSQKSFDHSGVPSLSEAAALAAAGAGSTLLGPRIVRDGVTCALARSRQNDTGEQP